MKFPLFLGFLALAAALTLLRPSHRDRPGGCDTCLPLPTELMPVLPPPLSLPYPAPPAPADWQALSAEARLTNVRARLLPGLADELARIGAQLGDATYLRVFKETRQMELWLRSAENWALFRSYPIATFSGTLGPKLQEGDRQAPEGFYSITPAALNPLSSYHLAIKIGYPNEFDRQNQRTGSFIMVHGREVSIGCFAMTDPFIEEIYLIVEAALKAGQREVPIHIFPFHMEAARLSPENLPPDHAWHDFWHQLQPAYTHFQLTRDLPRVQVTQGRYHLP